MADSNGAAVEEMPKPGALLEPLPTLKLVPEKLDAGLRSLDHCEEQLCCTYSGAILTLPLDRTRLPLWRYYVRQRIIPMVRWETSYLARMQEKYRSPALDTWFSVTANLGTHTFFLLFLPVLFWCGYTTLARAMIHTLGFGVIFTGVLKDTWCLPRPLSPPLRRITMSHSAALEYGFPSTHSTNAVSTTVYILYCLQSPESNIRPDFRIFAQALACGYAVSITLGRLYCGMHGFVDVGVGGALGVLLSAIQWHYGQAFDNYIHGSFKGTITYILIMLVLVRLHPEPADDCPCFDDSVAFAGVFIGIEFGAWHFGHSGIAWDEPCLATVPYQLDVLGFPITVLRIVLGILFILAWRFVAKRVLLRSLPPLFRVIEKLGLSLPRRFFVQASEYNKVPPLQKDDNVFPSVTEIPSLLASIRHPRKSRSVSIGPQSEADAYETLAYREQRRRQNKSEVDASKSRTGDANVESPKSYGVSTSNSALLSSSEGFLPTPAPSNDNLQKSLIEPERKLYASLTPDSTSGSVSRRPSQIRRQDEKEEREMFSKLEKPRVRYDVEVITKLIVYAGIGWLACEGAPILFDVIGLGIAKPIWAR